MIWVPIFEMKQIYFFRINSLIIIVLVAHSTVKVIAEAGDPVSLECPRERYKEYSEGLGSLIPPGDYTVR